MDTFRLNAEVLSSIPGVSIWYNLLLHGYLPVNGFHGSLTYRPQRYRLLGYTYQEGQYVGLILPERECTNNRVLRIRPVRESHSNTDISKKKSKGN